MRHDHLEPRHVPAIFGLMPHSFDVHDVWLDVTGRAPVREFDYRARRRWRIGQALVEELERRERRTAARPTKAIHIDPFQRLLRFKPHAHFIEPLTPILTKVAGNNGEVEAWARRQDDWGPWADRYFFEMQAVLAATFAPYGFFAVDGRGSFYSLRVPRDEPTIALIREAVTEFWRWVESDQPPPSKLGADDPSLDDVADAIAGDFW